ncbi:MAG: hypothetical protein OEY85_06490 [Rhodospirillales bacterium]|nr:hypothetical protein [Rhodospirillales bacterium]
MMRPITLGFAALLALTPLSGAFAVDVINQDGEDHTLIISAGETQKEMVIKAGETLTKICESCTIQLNEEEPLEAQEDEVVTIKEGKASTGG